MNFTERLRASQNAQNSLVCVGLDPDPRKIPQFLHQNENPVAEFNRRIVESTHDLVCAYKMNLAFYEALGEKGWQALRATLALIPKSVITIADGKRGDIGNSSEMYARSILEDFNFDASTVHPYMGFDSLQPFARNAERGVFVLALTSNPGAKDFQYLKVQGKPLYEHVIRRVKKWNTAGNFGLVVGATRPAQLKTIRALALTLPILIPGIGAQGGDLRKAVRYGCDASGFLALLTAARSVLYASSGEDFADAARAAALSLRDEINVCREEYFV
ncbi:MAG: orotidine 5'-phosphate decarboxylase [Bacteroidetes bacterium]|jgi:orotidine-5'-phosphate decarboxylase|nr:orotidine 5'-phosphate decarboxylase [Bacteroidota bacterium]